MELGIDVSTADMYYPNRIDNRYNGCLPIGMKLNNPLLSQEIPAWSLSALLDLIPDEEPLLQKIEGTWTITINRDEEHLDQFSNKTLIGTLYEAIKWLVENNYFKKNV